MAGCRTAPPAQNLVVTASPKANSLTWQPAPIAPDGDLAAYYVLYRFAANETPTPDDPRHILTVLRPHPGAGLAYVDTTARPGLGYAYYLTAVDRLHNESRPVNVRTTGRPVEIIVAQASANPAPVPPAVPPVATAPTRPTPSTTTRITTSAGSITKIKTKVKPRRKRGFFQRLFGGR
ncbi:hypothetical protein [Hymenobacter volaticus]|uniref:Fibronectin type-III domain-containing protein n=1 Tax=Hymenobacter volaticus TaxID=2932254 RepID=A0ABY4G2X6_9BACT|nr:hypothetical protein [Hymenobacter volaticus]UOQ65137.1 hypothetical protein MUN86_16455 [Hymenobacter volaticus]